ncbi:MAG TPA: NADH-quinone oxidoreductase subunit L [Chitinophagaceae bacterium]|nr:NADH-quinone oxidoreductase subunit L [Chitinophagaceae bacterium]
MPSYSLLMPVLLLPLVSFVLLGIFGRRYLSAAAGSIATLAMLLATGLAIYCAYSYFDGGKTAGIYNAVIAFRYEWLPFSEGVSIQMGAIIDPIAAMMIVVVCFISLMVHILSLGYMKVEGRLHAYYAFLSLFTFSMLGLVLSTNIFQLYIFWELVGVSSYLLIGFYFDKPAAVAASKKAFIVTRFADLGFLIGILLLAFYTETLDIPTLIERLGNANTAWSMAMAGAGFMGISALSWALLLLFAGGAGKSAIFPLHIWLPDAMEGPTPVSALIHAATMVVAGVYMVARFYPVFSMDAMVMDIIAFIGAASALIAAVIACTQTDIKRVLAYSTMSQIGYMMFALAMNGSNVEPGLGFTAGMFHLFTHAFFKSLLFLGAGAIIHLVHSNELQAMGGLRKRMPLTHAAFFIACLAIAGIPPLAGFFSKEEILTAAFNANRLVYAVGLLVSALTAFYMFRLYFSIFWAKEPALHEGHQEAGLLMKLPMVLLSIGAVIAGWAPFARFVTADGRPLQTHIDLLLAVPPVTLAVLGIGLAAMLYKKQNEWPARLSAAMGSLYTAAYKKFYIDEIYLFVTKKILFNAIGRPAAWIDRHVVDAAMNGLAHTTSAIAVRIRALQSGKIQNYTLYFFGGVAILTVLLLFVWK